MAEQNSYYSELNKVNTNGITLFDDKGNMLKLGYLGESFSGMISIPVKSESGKNTYPEKNRHSFLITHDRAAALYKKVILQDILESYASGQNMVRGIPLNRAKTNVLSIRLEDGELYLVFSENIDENRMTEDNYAFHFTKSDIIDEYNPKDGSYAGQYGVEGAFWIFCYYLKAGIYELCKPSGHSVRRAQSYTNQAIFNYLKAISQKLGVVVEPAFKKSSGFAAQSPTTEGGDDELPFSDVPSMNNPTTVEMSDMLK